MTSPGHKHRIVPLEVGNPKEVYQRSNDFWFSEDISRWVRSAPLKAKRKFDSERKAKKNESKIEPKNKVPKVDPE